MHVLAHEIIRPFGVSRREGVDDATVVVVGTRDDRVILPDKHTI